MAEFEQAELFYHTSFFPEPIEETFLELLYREENI